MTGGWTGQDAPKRSVPTSGAAAFRRAAFIVNRASRQAGRAARARDLLRTLGVPVAHSYALRQPGRLREVVRAALEDGADLIVLGGGDGSVSAAAGELAHRDAMLGLLPLGTANDFARTLGIPADLEVACATVAQGKIVDVDLGRVGDSYFVNVASIGLGAALVEAVSPALKGRIGSLAYPVAVARTLLRFRPFAATLTFPADDHRSVRFRNLLQIGVGNGRFYGAGAVVAPTAGIDDGTLDVYVIERGDWRRLLSLARAFRSGRFIRLRHVHYFRTTAVRIETDRPLAINADGELVDRTPVYVSLARNALRILIPWSSTAAKQDGGRRRRAARRGPR